MISQGKRDHFSHVLQLQLKEAKHPFFRRVYHFLMKKGVQVLMVLLRKLQFTRCICRLNWERWGGAGWLVGVFVCVCAFQAAGCLSAWSRGSSKSKQTQALSVTRDRVLHIEVGKAKLNIRAHKLYLSSCRKMCNYMERDPYCWVDSRCQWRVSFCSCLASQTWNKILNYFE